MIWVSGNTRFTLGDTANGALVRYNPSTQAIDYYGLPASIYDGQINGYWLAQTDSQVFMTLGKQGVFAVDKKDGAPSVFDQREGTKYFFTAASLTSKNEVAFSNGSDAGSLAIQIYNPTVNQYALSTYLIPTQSGQFSEGLTYDQRNGDVWYCERNPPVLGVLRH
jgi:streptogramin lyase